jgi:hypothetical protein
MSLKSQNVENLKKIIENINNDYYSERELEYLSFDVLPYISKITRLSLDEEKLTTYIFRGWFITELMERNNEASK